MSSTSYCRLCLQASKQCQPLIKDNGIQMLESLTAIKVSHKEKNLSEVCCDCYADLKLGFEIQQRFLKIERKHQEEMLADFLIENHEELVKIVQREIDDVENIKSPVKILDSASVKHTCKLCEETFHCSPSFVKHLQAHILKNVSARNTDDGLDKEVEEVLHCDHCQQTYTHQNEYEEHLKSIHSNECDRCLEVFALKPDLEAHTNAHKLNKPFICEVCNQGFALRYVLQLHKVQHNIDYRFECECGRKFKQEISLTVHQRMHHGGGGASCLLASIH